MGLKRHETKVKQTYKLYEFFLSGLINFKQKIITQLTQTRKKWKAKRKLKCCFLIVVIKYVWISNESRFGLNFYLFSSLFSIFYDEGKKFFSFFLIIFFTLHF